MNASKPEAVIFDMDGCLYPFAEDAQSFGESAFGQTIKANIQRFFEQRFGLEPAAATSMKNDLRDRFDTHISLGLEIEHGIPIHDFFEHTWDLHPADFVRPSPQLRATVERIRLKRALLTAAPTIWMDRVLDHLNIRDLFDPNLFDGSLPVRKPDPRAFEQVAKTLDVAPSRIIAIGDQEHTDIVPAKELGMLTVRIGLDSETAADFSAPDIASAINLLEERKLL